MGDSAKPRLRLYVLEDDEAVRDALIQLLELNDYDVQGFARPDAFLDAYDGEPGCLLLDVHLACADGLVFARDAVVGRLPLVVIVMTGSVDPEKRQTANRLNPAAVLLKPFSEQSLIESLRQAQQLIEDQAGPTWFQQCAV